MDCRGFDEQVVRRDPQVRELLARFVCVRLVQANDLDLTLFQFDYDLTFAAFFLNADRTVYGRFGSRSDRKDATKDISLEGFRAALAAALELHKGYPANRALLAGKQGRPTAFDTPDRYPFLQGRYRPKLDYEGKLVQSCMHCHQIGEATRRFYRDARKPIPDEVLRPWPMPDVLGLSLDPKQKATITRVASRSVAAKAGLRVGDAIVTLDGQPVLSLADVQWVLQGAAAPATLRAEVLRGLRRLRLTLRLDPGWRGRSEFSWRVTTWDLRRMAAGGLVLASPAADVPREGKRPPALALTVEYVGEYGEHAVGKQAGFKKGDLIVEVDGHTEPWTESQLLAYLLTQKLPGSRVPVTVVRGGERLRFELPQQ